MNDNGKPIIRLIGIGMDGGRTLTAAASYAAANSDVIFGAKRVTEPFLILEKPVFNTWKASEIAEIVKSGGFERPVVLLSGDCGFYSAADGLVKELGDFETEIICGISAPVYFSSKIKIPWQDMKFVSLHGTDNSIAGNVCRNEYCFFLLGGEFTVNTVCGRLCEYGLSGVRVYVGENLGYQKEKISLGTAADFVCSKHSPLSVMLTENPNFERGARFGIPDDEFKRGRVPMTKSEVRAVIMSRLGAGCGEICWDIGCGTGSVSVETALAGGVVYALDTNPEAAELTRENARKFRCDNIHVIEGGAPEALKALPAPDCVFIGGSGGLLREILNAVYSSAKSGARIVVPAVTLNTLETARRCLTELGAAPETVQISAARAGAGGMLTAMNPIFIISAVKGEQR